MTVILIRTLIVYLMLTLVMRLMGKRQLGELQVSELISTLVLSEVAALPIADPNIPLLFSILPVGLIFSLEIILPGLFFRFPLLRKWVEGTPSFLIKNGEICQAELHKNRITPEEFMAALRSAGYADPADVNYAILEASGTVSVFPYASTQPPTCRDLTPPALPEEVGIAHVLVADGKFNTSTVKGLGLTESDILKLLRPHHRPLQDVYLLTRDDSGKIRITWRSE